MSFRRLRLAHALCFAASAIGPTVLPLAACTAVAVTSTAARAAAELPPARAHGALFAIPDGWQRSERADGATVLSPSDAPRDAQVQIILARPETPRPTLRDHLESDLDEGRKGISGFTTDGEAEATRHPAGYEMLTQAASWPNKTWNTDPNRGMADLFGRSFAVIRHIEGGPEMPSQGIMFVASSKALMAKYRPTFEAFCSGLRLASRVTLVPSAGADLPPLTLYTVNRYCDFVEWLLEVPMTQSQRAEVQEFLRGSWTSGSREGIDAVGGILKGADALRAMEPAKRDQVRENCRRDMLRFWRAAAQKGDAASKLMVQVYDAGHVALAKGGPGEPPLTRQAADAALEVTYFMASRVAGGGEARPSKAQLDKFAAEMAAGYAALPKARKDEIAGMPAAWGMLRLSWPEASAGQRAALVARWSESGPVKQVAAQIKQSQAQSRPIADRLNDNKDLYQKMRDQDTRVQLFHMGALRMNHTYIKW
jgi:hypothetical protein